MRKLFYLVLVVLCASFNQDQGGFYKALSSNSESRIEQELITLGKLKQSSQHLAFEGALLMKKASFEKSVNNKVKLFKKGARLLETEIESNSSSVEFRFIRLAVQEHAPGVLKYNKKLQEDKTAVIQGFSKLGSALKAVILDYSKTSKVLKETDLKGN
jgi:hypothetical protein